MKIIAMKNKKTGFNKQLILLLIILTIVCLFYGCLSNKTKIYRVGVLFDGQSIIDMIKGFKIKMAEFGYIENKNIIYYLADGNGDMKENKRLAEKFVADKVDLIYSLATPSTIAAYNATRETKIPVLFSYIGTEESVFVKSNREPGGNLTGVRYPGPELQVRRLEILKEIAPKVRRVWLGFDINNPANKPALMELRKTASILGVTLIEVPGNTIEDIKKDLKIRNAMNDPGLDAIILMPDGFNHMPAGLELITQFALKHKIPVAGSFQYTVVKGAIFGNTNNSYKVGELAAPIADKIIKGTPPGIIPVVTPDQYLIINYKLAQKLGLKIPKGLLKQADEIIR